MATPGDVRDVGFCKPMGYAAVLTTARQVRASSSVRWLDGTFPRRKSRHRLRHWRLSMGLYLLPGVVWHSPGGFLGRRFGDKRVAATGLLLMCIGAILGGASDSYELAVPDASSVGWRRHIERAADHEAANSKGWFGCFA